MKTYQPIKRNDDFKSIQKLPIWPRTVTKEICIFNRNNAEKMQTSENNMIISKQNLQISKESFEKPKAPSIIEMSDSSFEKHSIKFPSDFEILEFRNKLRGTKFTTELRRFLSLMNRDSSILTKFIEMSGKPLELAEALQSIKKTNLPHQSCICQALQKVLSEIITNYPALKESAVTACQYVLNVHSSVIEQLFKSTQLIHRRIALRLLTTIVNVDPQMSGQILTAFTMLSDLSWININLSHCKLEQNEQESVRKCFIKFVLAFLVDGNSLLIKNLMNRRALIQALVHDLLYDDHVTVCLVLNTLKEHILENANISKTKKVYVFGLECCKRLVLLYDWLGPSVEQKNFTSPVNLEKREIVAISAHEFLLTLLSSHEHGIAFSNASTYLEQKHNSIPNKIIGFLQKPWNCKRKTELIVKILKACPELARCTMRRFSDIINPHRTDTSEFIATANFLIEIISTLHTDNTPKQITLTDFVTWIKDICLPSDSLTALRYSNMLVHSNFECRLATHRLLLAMFSQYSKFVAYAMQQENFRDGSTALRHFKYDLYNHILAYFPSVENILESLNLITNETVAMDASAVLKHLNVTFDLILIICKQDHSIFKQTRCKNILTNLYPLFDCEEDSGDGFKRKSNLAKHVDIELELKVVKTILLLDPNALKPQQELFLPVLKSFIKGFINGSAEVQRKSGNLLREIFKNTGIFGKSTLEIDLWLEVLHCFDKVTVEGLTENFINILRVSQDKVGLPAKVKAKTNQTSSRSKLLPLIFRAVEIVTPPVKYIELVCLLLFHYHPRPSYIANLFEMKYKTLPRYMRTWLSAGPYDLESKSLELPKLCDRIPFLKNFQIALLKGFRDTTFEEIFGSTNDDEFFEIEVEQKKYKLSKILQNERLLMIYTHQVMFLVIQLLKKQQLVRLQVEFAAKCIINFLAILHEMEQKNDINYTEKADEIVKHSFLNRILAYVYDVRLCNLFNIELFNSKNAQCLHYLYFLTLISAYCSKLPKFLKSVKNFRLKLFRTAAKNIEEVKQSKPQTNTDFIRIINAFQLDVDNCRLLLDLMCKKLSFNDFFIETNNEFQRTFYYDLLICIVKRLTELQQTIGCEQHIKVLAEYYVYFVMNISIGIDLADFEKVFYDFLCIVHKDIPRLDSKLFTCLFEKREINEWNVKLACLLLEHYNNMDEHFVKLLHNQFDKRDLIFPLLEVAINKKINMNKTVLMKIYLINRNDILKSIENPQNADQIFKKHSACSIALVKSCMSIAECKEFCKKRFRFNNACEIHQIHLITAIYEKAWNARKKDGLDGYAKLFVNYLSLQIQLLSNDLKRNSLNVEKLELFLNKIDSWFTKIQKLPAAADYDFQIIFRSDNWLNFYRSCLDIGMRTNENFDTQNGLLLQLLAYLCDKFYVDYIGTNKNSRKRTKQSESTELFKMIIMQPKYYNILITTKPTKVKTSVLSLLYTLAKKSPKSALIHLKIPVILSAFHGEQSVTDRYIMALLNLCELYIPNRIQQYHPFIWRLYSLHILKQNKNISLESEGRKLYELESK